MQYLEYGFNFPKMKPLNAVHRETRASNASESCCPQKPILHERVTAWFVQRYTLYPRANNRKMKFLESTMRHLDNQDTGLRVIKENAPTGKKN